MSDLMMKEKSISTLDWVKKYEKEFIERNKGQELELFHFVVNKLDIFRFRIILNCGLSPYNKSHEKIIDRINEKFKDLVNNHLTEKLNIRRSEEGDNN